MADPDARFDVQPTAGNHFAWLRTTMALQRTLLAGVRTGVSLIGFGFTVAQFFQRLQGDEPSHFRLIGPDLPRNLGLTLIGAGLLSVAIFTWHFHAGLTTLRSAPYDVIATSGDKPAHTSSYFVASIVMLIGVAAFISVFLRL